MSVSAERAGELHGPASHYGTCGICREATTWCMAGYWSHDEDRPHDHAAVTLSAEEWDAEMAEAKVHAAELAVVEGCEHGFAWAGNCNTCHPRSMPDA